ncbi:MAG: hypothetical protein M3Q65_05185 [Chloroflexota bacterium]|nr:hypothetical protein [Chloroflexota bacterium]
MDKESALRRIPTLLRFVIVLGFILAAIRIFVVPSPVDGTAKFWLWFCLAFAIGLVLARRWALLLAPSPTIAFWYNVSTGRRPRLSDAWEVGAIVITAIGLAGIALGLVVGRGLSKAGLWR